MNKVVIASFSAVILLIIGVIVLSGEDASVPDNEFSANTNLQESNTRSPVPEQADGGYQEYSEAALASAVDTKRVVFFHAPWCSTCNAFEKEILEQGVPDGITILKADYDNDTDLRQQYNVRLQSTFVLLDTEGNVEQTWPFGQGLSGDISNLYDQVL
jgi:thiol:disulfide interchange protein